MENTQREGFLAKRRGKSILTVLLVVVIAGLVGPASSLAASRKHDPGTCVLSQSAAGDLVATASGLSSNTMFGYQIYSSDSLGVPFNGASVGGGELSTGASGSFSYDLGPYSFFMNEYPSETGLTLDLYPLIGNKTDFNIVVASC